MYGLTVEKGQVCGLARRPTGFMINSSSIFENLSQRCNGQHGHVPLIGGNVTAQAAAYPQGIVDAILKGLKKELQNAGRLQAMEDGGPTIDEPEPDAPLRSAYWDEITGVSLDAEQVHKARLAEVAYMHKLNVYTEATMAECLADGCTLIPMRWIDINKGDAEQVNIRSRAVLQETRKRSNLGPNDVAATFAATPPLEGLRVLCSLAMTGQQGVPLEDRKVIGIYDVSRAHWHSPAKRRMYVKVVPEDTSISTGIARLNKAMYGGRDAGNCWDEFAGDVMQDMEFKAGQFCSCVYHSEKRDSTCWRHGDDFGLLATRAEHARFLEEANKKMILKHMGTLGPLQKLGDLKEIRVLNRILRYVQLPYASPDQGYLEWEADPRHREILMANQGMTETSKGLGQPGCKRDAKADETPLDETRKSAYRSDVMRLSYLAQDRPDIQFASKELARQLNNPTQWDAEQLKRVVRYLKGSGRIAQQFRQQPVQQQLTAYSDSDFAGCTRSRKSTSCCLIFLGAHMLRSTSTTQAIISLSSGEAEFYAAVKATSIALGLTNLIRDMGMTFQKAVRLCVDSTACLGMAGRKGVGRVRHLHTPCLWLQQAVASAQVTLEKVLGTINPADLGTKVLSQEPILRILAQCGFKHLSGTSKLALRAAV